MARMIPEHPSEDTKSGAERKLFSLFRDMPDTDEWIVLHSLSIAKHITQSQGEADFVIIIPSHGVFVLEIKGGRVSHENGKWYSVDRDDITHQIKNPVEEASNAMHSFRAYVSNSSCSDRLDHTLFGFGVVFPGTSFHGVVNSVELADEQIADFDDCLSSSSIKNYLLRLAGFWKKTRAPGITLPTLSQCTELAMLFRPNFDGKISLRSMINNVENQVVQLTENQQDIFDTICENERCLVRGDAGTGKTIIALHFAKEQRINGNNTGFFCYNTQLSRYLQKHISLDDNLVCGSFTAYMVSKVEEAGMMPLVENNTTARNLFFSELLPQLFMDAFITLECAQFDCLILDEAQDLMTDNYLEVFDLILKGGIANGRWYFFLDADRQNLYNTGTTNESINEMLRGYGAHFTKCLLRDNCRNSVSIIQKIDSIFGTKTRHRHNDETGADVVIKSNRKTSDSISALDTVIRTLLREGVTPNQIVVLSPIRFDNSIASMSSEHNILPENDIIPPNSIRFSTIHSFKGLESSVVILVDIDNLSSDSKMNLLYVGMTRAKSALYIIANDKAAKILS